MSFTGTSLNPGDVASGAGTNVPILADGNLFVTCTANNNFAAIRSLANVSAGQYTWSVTAAGNIQSFTPAPGLAETGASLNAFGATSANWPGGVVWQPGGGVSGGGAGRATWQAYQAGDVLTFALDVDRLLLWGQVNGGAWNNSFDASPQSGNGGLDISFLAAPLSVAAWMNSFGAGAASLTFNFTAPPGFPPQPLNCLGWARVIPPGRSFIEFWSGGGKPEALTGGMPFSGKFLPGATLFLTAQGTGDSQVNINTQPPPGNAPKGFYPGWPDATRSNLPGDLLNAATAKGSAVGHVIANQASFPTVPGLVQSTTGVRAGRFYFEYTVTYDIFSEATGVGVGRLSPDINAWFNKGGFSVSDTNGGLFVDGGVANAFTSSIDGATIAGPSFGSAPSGSLIGVAVVITTDYIPAIFNAQQLQPVPLVCIPCRELLIGPKGFGGFGR